MFPLLVSALTDDEVALNIEKGNNNSLILTWNANSTQIDIYRSTNESKGYKVIATVDNNTYTDTKVKYGTTYYYKLVFKNEDGFESKVVSNKVVPNKVTDVVLTPGNKQIKVSYDKTSNSGYKIYRSTDATSGFKKVKTISKARTTSFTDKSLKANTVYYYKVRAYQIVKGKKVYGKYSDVVNAKTAPGNGTISSLKAVNYNEIDVNIRSTSGATYYKVYRSTSKNKGYKKIGSTDTLVYNDTKVLPTKTYYYKIKACNEENKCGNLSKPKKAKTSVKKVSANGKSMTSSIQLEFNKIDYATGYDIYQSTDKNKNYKKVKTVDNNTVTIGNLKPGTKYYFKIKTFVKIDSKKYYSGYSKMVTVKPTMKKVTDLIVTSEKNSVSLEFKYPDYEEAIKFQIQRSTSESGKYITVATIKAKDAYKDNNYLYTETDLDENKTYYYKVRATVKVGKKTYNGAFSDVKNAVTGTIYVPDLTGALNKANEVKDTIVDRNQLKDILTTEGFDETEIEYALSNVSINWNTLALNYVNSLVDEMKSKFTINNTLIDKGFTSVEIESAFNTANVDFKEIAYSLAQVEYQNYTESELMQYLISCKFTEDEINYAMDLISYEYNPIKIVNRIDNNTISLGDEVKIENEHFYVASINESKTLLLPKYNLKVGRSFTYDYGNYELIKEYSSSDEGFGLQSEETLGYKVENYNEENTVNGVINFSVGGELYWNGKVGTSLESEYYGTYGESPYPYVYDSNCAAYEHVERYVNYLKEFNVPVIKGRLMSPEEAQALETAKYEWLFNTSFWLGSVGDNNSEVWTVDAAVTSLNGSILRSQINDGNSVRYGVRPVIEIATTDMPGGRNFGM